jgi:hypothetical protein
MAERRGFDAEGAELAGRTGDERRGEKGKGG